MKKLTKFGNQWTWALGLLLCVVGLAASACRAASATTAILTTGTYAATTAAPDIFTTTAATAIKATGGSAAPERMFDQGQVRITSKVTNATGGAVVTFSGRSTGWGCVYHVHGNFLAPGGGNNFWVSKFTANTNPRIALEINGPGTGDDVVLPGANGGTLSIWVFGEPPGTPVALTLSTSSTDVITGLPGSVDVTPGIATPKIINLTGGSAGTFTITAGNDAMTATISGQVFGWQGQIKPDDPFTGRSTQKLGVGEFGDLVSNGDVSDAQPLTWTSTDPTVVKISGSDPLHGKASFQAGEVNGRTTLTLTDKNGHQQAFNISVVQPTRVIYTIDPAATVFHVINVASCGFKGVVHYQPTDVSFAYIQTREETVDATTHRGCYGNFTHPQGDWISPTAGNFTNGSEDPASDLVRAHSVESYGTGGFFQWDIPWRYKVLLGSGNDYLLFDVSNTWDCDNTGKVTVSKGGASISRSITDGTVTAGWPAE